MSREFGSYESGYFDYQMDNACSDCKEGDEEITRLWGDFFEHYKEIAYAISSVEACDWSLSQTIWIHLQKMDEIQDSIDKIKDYLKPFKGIAEESIDNYLKGKGK